MTPAALRELATLALRCRDRGYGFTAESSGTPSYVAELRDMVTKLAVAVHDAADRIDRLEQELRYGPEY